MTDVATTKRLVPALLCCLFVAVPFLLVTYAPITDLPQHSAQIRLFLETLADPAASPYRIQWFTPYSLSYVLLGWSWGIFGAANAGTMAMLAIGILWVLAIHLTASTRNRSTAAATLGCLFIFNHVVSWGFYSFAVGWPVFLLWFALVGQEPPRGFSPRDCLVWLCAGLLLYMSHVLWFAVGVGWLLLRSLVFRTSLKGLGIRLAYLIPVGAAVWIWYPALASSSMSTPALWTRSAFERLSLDWFTDAALGGIHGWAEPLVICGVLAWIPVALLHNRENLKALIDWELLLASLAFFILALALPDKYMNTIQFGVRWMPESVVLLLLALPAPNVRPYLEQVFSLAVVAGFCVAVSTAWMNVQRYELSGLTEALAALPAAPRVLGLDFVRHSRFVKGWPFIQTFAYAQVFKGGTLNFSFAEFSPCLVVYKRPFRRPWTGGLEWVPGRLKESDLDFFDFALVGGNEKVHGTTLANSRMKAVTKDGVWRLYRIEHQGRALNDGQDARPARAAVEDDDFRRYGPLIISPHF